MFRHATSLTLILSALAATSRADTYTWSGLDGAFSNPTSWSTPAPASPGSATQQLLFPLANSPYTATIDLPWTANDLIFTSTGYISLTASPGAGLIFDGPNPTITSGDDSPGSLNLNTPITTTSSLAFGGSLTYTLTGPLVSTGGGTLALTDAANLTYQNNVGPVGFSQTLLAAGFYGANLAWNITVPDSNPLALSFGSGPIVSQAGAFSVNLVSSSQTDTLSAIISNPINVQGYLRLGGSGATIAGPGNNRITLTALGNLLDSLSNDSNTTTWIALRNLFEAISNAPPPITPASTASVNFSGPVSLAGQLFLTSGYSSTFLEIPAQLSVIQLSGTITLDQSATHDLELVTSGGSQNQRTIISGNIVDDPDSTHTAHNPLLLFNGLNDASSEFIIAGTHNTYSTGTILEYGSLTVAAGSSLGTGFIELWTATLHLTSLSNVNPGQTVLLHADAGGTLALNFDAQPYAIINPASGGNLALDVPFFTPLDMSRLGNGKMSLSSTNGSPYLADSLRPAADHTYRLAGTLILPRSVLTDYDGIPSKAILNGATIAAANSYSGGTTVTGDATAAAPNALGSGNVTIGTYPGYNSAGRLFISAANVYQPTAQVDIFGTLNAVGPGGAIPLSNTAPILHPGSALILGDGASANSDRYPDAMPVNLNGSTLIIKGLGTTAETVGPITVSDLSTIVLWNPSAGTNLTTLTAPSLIRNGHAALYIVPFQLPANYWDELAQLQFAPAGANAANVQIANTPLVTNGMVAPWIQYRGMFYDYSNNAASTSPQTGFLTYTSSGFAFPIYGAMPQGPGSSTEVVDAPSENGDLILSGDKSIYALRTSANILANDPSPRTLYIASGGLIGESHHYDGNNLSITIQPNVDFMDAEACINVQGVTTFYDKQILDIQGIVTAGNGLTKFGTGTLRLSNPASQIHGPITILEGTLELASLPDPASTDPIRLSNGAGLSFLHSTVLSRPVLVTAGSSPFGPYSSIYIAPGQSLVIAAPISVPDAFLIIGDAPIYSDPPPAPTSLKIAAPITGSMVAFSSAHIDLESTITSPSVSFYVGRGGELVGSGIIASTGTIYFSQGAISPGANHGDIAALTFAVLDLELDDGASFSLDLDPAGHSDRILITGTLTFDANKYDGADPVTLSLDFLAPPTGQTYTLLSASQITGTFDSVTGLPAGYALQYTPTSLLLVPTTTAPGAAVPEPASLTTLALGSLLLLRRRRRQA